MTTENPPPSDPRDRLRALVPAELVDAYSNDPIVHAVLHRAAIGGTDLQGALIELVLELVAAKQAAIAAHTAHLEHCTSGPPMAWALADEGDE